MYYQAKHSEGGESTISNMRVDKKRQREPFSFGTGIHFQLKNILTCLWKHIHQSGRHTLDSVKEPFEALLDLCLPCHPRPSHIFSLPFSILAAAEMGIRGRGRVREKMWFHLEVSFASLKVPSDSFLDNLQFHLRGFSGPPLSLLHATLWLPLYRGLSPKLE